MWIYEANEQNEVIPSGFEAVLIPLNGKVKSSLDWTAARKRAEEVQSFGLKIFFDIDLGLFSDCPPSFSRQTWLQALQLSLEHFTETLWKEFNKDMVGISIYRGPAFQLTSGEELYHSHPQTLNFDSARQSQTEALRSERRSPSPSGKGEEEDQFGKVVASQNSKFEGNFGINLSFQPSLLFWILQSVLFQLLPFLLTSALFLLSFDEKKRQKKLILEAKQKMEALSPYTIGITGSYGKTSTKEALGQLLQLTCGSTFWPQKGINTEMGMTRAIREELKNNTHFSVIEMGAYGRGSIQRLTNLTPPQAAIITGVGVAHLDRFKDPETIYQAKSELAQAVPQEGILVCNGDNPGARRMAKEQEKKTTLLYGLDNTLGDLNCWMVPESSSLQGSHFTLYWEGKRYTGMTPLIGRTALLNVAGAFAMTCALGADPEWAIAALSVLKPVDNRLEVKEEGGKLYLKDAYNSNPEGFLSALQALGALPAKKRFLMTPGMIELADQQESLHISLGKEAAKVCDQVIIVGQVNRDSLKKGLLLGGMAEENIFQASTRSQGFEILEKEFHPGDAVLIENDLPDLYEKEEFF